MRALVTGATGFVGSHLAEALLARGWAVRCATRAASNLRWLTPLPVERVDVDWRDVASLARATADIDVVFHVAGVLSGAAVEAYTEGNVAQTGRLLAATPESARFVYVSSVAACGRPSESDSKGRIALNLYRPAPGRVDPTAALP